jgi:hypothetical protein
VPKLSVIKAISDNIQESGMVFPHHSPAQGEGAVAFNKTGRKSIRVFICKGLGNYKPCIFFIFICYF